MEQQFEKEAWSAFIANKRKAKGLTQQELAEQLYVSNSAISKWERGLSFPDITLVIPMCKALDISEHEFFQACDDLYAKQQEKQAKGFRNIKKGFFLSLPFAYAIAVITCFICNLAVDQTLSWFWIVLVSILLAASITTLPKLLQENRWIVSSGVATVLLFILLWVCNLTVDMGDLGETFLIAALPVVLYWISLLLCLYTGLSSWVKAAMILVLSAGFIVVSNPFIDWAMKEPQPRQVLDYISPNVWNGDVIASKITAYALVAVAVVCLIIGMGRGSRHKQ